MQNREFIVEVDGKQTKFKTAAKTSRGIIRAARKAVSGSDGVQADSISPAWRDGWWPISNESVRKDLGIE